MVEVQEAEEAALAAADLGVEDLAAGVVDLGVEEEGAEEEVEADAPEFKDQQ